MCAQKVEKTGSENFVRKFSSPSPTSISYSTSTLSTPNTISQLTTNTPIEAIMNMLNNRLEVVIELRESEEREKENEEEKKGDPISDIEEDKLKEEKEHEEFIEEVKEKEKEEEMIEVVVEEAEKLIEERLLDEETIAERIDEQIEIAEELGVKEFVEAVESLEKEEEIEIEEIKEEIKEEREQLLEELKEMKEEISERIEVIEQLEKSVEKAEKDGNGVDKLIKDIEELAKSDRSLIGKDLEELIEKLKEIGKSKENDEEKMKRANEFIDDFIAKHSKEREIFDNLKKIEQNFDKLSLEEIKKQLKELREGISETIDSLKSKSRKLEDILFKKKDAPQAVGESIKDVFKEEPDEIKNLLRNVWINSVVEFLKRKLDTSEKAKDEEGKKEWKDSLQKAEEWRASSIEEFNRRMSNILRKKDFNEAMRFASLNVIATINDIISSLERGRYADDIDKIIRTNKKEEARIALERMIGRWRIIEEKIHIIRQLAENGSYKEISDILSKLPNSFEQDPAVGCFGRILVKTTNRMRNKAKKELIAEYIRFLNSTAGLINTIKSINDAAAKKDFKQVDENVIELIEHVNRLYYLRSQLYEVIRNKKLDKNKKRKMIARLVANIALPKDRIIIKKNRKVKNGKTGKAA